MSAYKAFGGVGAPSSFSSPQEAREFVRETTADIDRLRAEVGHATGSLREFEYISYRAVSLLRRMGLSEDLETAMSTMQRAILTVRMLHSAFIYLQSGTPYGLILGLITLGGTFLTVGDTMYDATRGRQ